MSAPKDIGDILNRLSGVKSTGQSKWTADCPVSGHKTPKDHLSIQDAENKVLVQCFGNYGHSYEDICQALGFETLAYSDSYKPKVQDGEIEAIYHYTDANGKPFEVVRTRPKGFYQRQPDGKGGYILNLNGILPTLYHQNDLKSAILHGDTVFITEGEKDCDNLWQIGLVATTNPGGAGKWKAAYSEALRGASVVILPHKDQAGRKHGRQIAASLYYGIAKTLKVVELPGGDIKDVSDWLKAGGDDLQLRNIVENTSNWQPEIDSGDVILKCIADVQPETVQWLWYPYIPYRKLTLLEGDPGTGKSWCGLAIATAQSLGKGLPGVDSLQASNVLIISAEDGLSDTIRPRLSAFEADISRIYAIDGLFTLDKDGCETLEGYIQQLKPRLVIIDPLVAYLSGEVDIHKANQVRQVTAHLARLAEKHGPAIITIRHLTKGGSLKPIYRGLGSIDFTAAARSVLLAGSDSDNPQTRGIVHLKCNLAPLGEAIGYELRQDGFFWTGHSDLTAGEILSADDGGSALKQAITFLNEMLCDGPITASEISTEADSRGISKRTLNRAKEQLGIVSEREGKPGKKGGGRFLWRFSDGGNENTF